MAKQSVEDAFIAITSAHEGVVPWPYLDRLGLVTTGIGNLVENRATGLPTEAYYEQPWQNGAGKLATRAELLAAFQAVKARQDLASLGGGNAAFAALTDVRLGPPGTPVNVVTPEIRSFVTSVLASFEAEIKSTGVHAFDSLNADAQLALLEHAWAAGPSFSGWPHLCAALNSNPPDYRTALIEDHVQGVTPQRDQMTRDLWTNAANAQDSGQSPETLFYPGSIFNPGPFASLSAAASRAGPAVGFLGTIMIGGSLGYLGYRLSSGFTRNPFRPGMVRRLI